MREEPFFGRKRELEILRESLGKRIATLIVIKGRRRIGKTRLIQEFSSQHKHYRFVGLAPEEKVTAQDQRNEFVRQMKNKMGIRGIKSDDWGDIFWNLSQHLGQGRIILVFDEINWMGSLDSTFLSKLKTAWDEYFKPNPQIIFILSGSMSTWIEKNILSSTGFFGRISIDMTLDELPLYYCNQFWSPNADQVAPYEKFKVLTVTGGVPRYLEEINPKISAEENIRRLCFRKEALLFNEFERIFNDLFGKRSTSYKKIIRRLSQGLATQQQIADHLKIEKSGLISDYLADLEFTGYIARDYTWSLKTGNESKLSRYRLRDNYLRFYLKYIEPNRTKIENLKFRILPAWDSIMGIQFENLVLNNRRAIFQILRIPSDPVTAPHLSDDLYDGTMRTIAFMTYDNKIIDIEFLYCFWKLPKKSLQEEGSLTEKHKSFSRSSENYSPVSPEFEEAVTSQLRQALPLLYRKLL